MSRAPVASCKWVDCGDLGGLAGPRVRHRPQPGPFSFVTRLIKSPRFDQTIDQREDTLSDWSAAPPPPTWDYMSDGASSDSSQPRNASRLAVDSPRSLRHSHSLRIEVAKPSSRRVLNDSSAYASTEPSSRSSSSGVTEQSGSRASR